MIEVKKVSYKSIIKDVSLKLESGKLIMVLGENGCGKTTLFKILLDIYPASSGNIYWEGESILNFSKRNRAKIFSYVPQIKNIVETMTVKECVVSGRTRFLSNFEIPSEMDFLYAENILKELHILHLKDRLLSEISGGELQLCFVARALIQDAEVLVMDEPCTYLDFQKQYSFMEKIISLKKTDKTLLLSVHDPNLAIRYADEVYFMQSGCIYEHISRTDQDFKEGFIKLYTTLFGSRFSYDKTSDFIYWK